MLDRKAVKKAKEMLSEGCTKKSICDFLGIKYNTARLAKIIEDFDKEEEIRKRKRKENTGTPLREDECSDIILHTFAGRSARSIADFLFRPKKVISAAVLNLGVPFAPAKNKQNQEYLMPESCVVDSFEPGELAWSCRYHAPCTIKEPVNERGYWIWVHETMPLDSTFSDVKFAGFNAASLTHSLGSLKHLHKYVSDKELLNAYLGY